MKYSEVLFPYQPAETGDFMRQYIIDDREYIVYSPEEGKVSCLELCYFEDLTAYQLAVSINRQGMKEQKEVLEFTFDHVCSKEKLIAYLFDIDNTFGKTSDRQVRHVSGNEGFFLYDLNPGKVRNFYQFNPSTKIYNLLFENKLCCAKLFEDTGSDTINICWNPYLFSVLEGQPEKQPSYLLASSNPVVCAYIYKKAQDKKINLYVGKNYLEGLLFFSYYINKLGGDKGLEVFSDGKYLTIEMTGWKAVGLVKFISRIQKIFDQRQKKLMGEEEPEKNLQVYKLESAGELSFVVFPVSDIMMEIFFKNILPEFGLENISYLDI